MVQFQAMLKQAHSQGVYWLSALSNAATTLLLTLQVKQISEVGSQMHVRKFWQKVRRAGFMKHCENKEDAKEIKLSALEKEMMPCCTKHK